MLVEETKLLLKVANSIDLTKIIGRVFLLDSLITILPFIRKHCSHRKIDHIKLQCRTCHLTLKEMYYG